MLSICKEYVLMNKSRKYRFSLTVKAYRSWAEDCIRLAALAKLAQFVLAKRVHSAII